MHISVERGVEEVWLCSTKKPEKHCCKIKKKEKQRSFSKTRGACSLPNKPYRKEHASFPLACYQLKKKVCISLPTNYVFECLQKVIVLL